MSPTHTERDAPHRAYDEEDLEEDYAMPHRYAAANGPASGSDREISLGTGTILAIFFALALVCSVFFGLGYTTGRKSTPAPTVALAEAPSRSLGDSFKSFKPAPGGPPVAKEADAKPESTEPSESLPEGAVVVPSAKPTSSLVAKSATPLANHKPFDPDAEIVTDTTPKPPTIARATPPAAPAILPVNLGTGTTLVQVSAVSHQEDADTVVAALKRKGYIVAVRHEPQDKFLHIQLGPYPSKKDAEAMRQRLQSDGFNAILK